MPVSREITLSDSVLLLRPPLLSDLQAIYVAVVESINEISPWMSWCYPGYPIEDTRRWLDTLPGGWAGDENYAFTIFDPLDGAVLGGCGLNHINWHYRLANLGYWVRTSRARRGIASRATHLVARFGFEYLGLLRAEVVVAVGNQASLRTAEKAGAQREGILRNRLLVGGQAQDAVMHFLIPRDFGIEEK